MNSPTWGRWLPAVLLMTAPQLVHADEGMWLYTNPPLRQLQDRYGFTPDARWLEHLQKSSVRFNSGGSGSFVSADGLVMTNHHVAADALQKLSSAERNFLRDGFLAADRSQEVKCVDLELNVLMAIEDVTARVNAAVRPDMSPEQAFAARREITAAIEKESLEKTGLRSNVITLYQGGQYHLYRFKKYTDVRLAFAPEQQIAFFGGDPDNFEFPRYALDVAFFRVYENDRPAQVEHHLAWSQDGSRENELTFVSGHPGRTNRMLTVDELAYLRDHQYPMLLAWLYRQEVLLSAFSDRSAENARRAKDDLFGIQNSRKARIGGLAGLMDPAVMARKKTEEARLRSAVAAKPELKDCAGAWDTVRGVVQRQKQIARDFNLLEGGRAFNSAQFQIARTLLRGAEERAKPNGERLAEFRDSNLESLTFQLFSEEPIHDDLEQLKLADALTYLAEQLGYEHEITQKILAGKSPRDRAFELISGTKLKDVAVRKTLWEGGADAVAASNDPMIALARAIDADARRLRQVIETEVSEVKQQAYAKIARAKYAVEGENTYPDATFTLRLSIGTVKGYVQDGQRIAPFTTFAGLYARSKEHDAKPPFDLPPRWTERKAKINWDTPFNFVSTHDIIGGNSGSPVVNVRGEVVGLIFDGNIQSLVLDFLYTDEVARAVSVDSRSIIEALRNVYDAGFLADELTARK